MTQLNWFPGHMARARREMSEALKLVDAVIELIDARLPLASANPLLHELIGGKPKLVVMTRVDMADAKETSAWLDYFESRHQPVVGIDARSGHGIAAIEPAVERAAAAKRAREAKRGIRPRPLRCMVVGIPNVGKSSLINRMAGKSSTKTGDRPGVTKTQQWIHCKKIDLLDTPGVLWPKLADERGAYMLAISGAIRPEVLDSATICAYFVIWCASHYPQFLMRRYELSELPMFDEWTDAARAWEMTEPLIRGVALRHGLLLGRGEPDLERSCDRILRDVQTGLLGRMSFEWASEALLRR